MKNILIYCARRTTAILANCPLFETERVITASRWADVPSMARETDCLIVCVERCTQTQLDDLQTIARRKQRPSIVIVTERCPENVRLLSVVQADAVIWFEEVETELVPTVMGLLHTTVFDDLAKEFAAFPDVNTKTVKAIRTALSAPQPYREVNDLARELRCDRRTVWRDWKNAQLPHSMQELLDWIVLLRALSAKHAGLPWKRVSERVAADR